MDVPEHESSFDLPNYDESPLLKLFNYIIIHKEIPILIQAIFWYFSLHASTVCKDLLRAILFPTSLNTLPYLLSHSYTLDCVVSYFTYAKTLGFFYQMSALGH